MSEEYFHDFLKQITIKMESLYPELEFVIGFSRICKDVPEYLRGIREARTAVQFRRKNEKISSFEKTGILVE